MRIRVFLLTLTWLTLINSQNVASPGPGADEIEHEILAKYSGTSPQTIIKILGVPSASTQSGNADFLSWDNTQVSGALSGGTGSMQTHTCRLTFQFIDQRLADVSLIGTGWFSPGCRIFIKPLRRDAQEPIPAGSPIAPPPAASGQSTRTSISSEILTNQGIIKLVEAGFQDEVLTNMIKAFSCRFDLGADALIALKQAHVSDSVIHAMLRAPFAPTLSSAVNGTWRLLNSDAVRILHEQGDIISVSGRLTLPNGMAVDTAYDLAKQSDGTYTGHVIARWQCQFQPTDKDGDAASRVQECPLDEQIVLTKLEPGRIEGKILHRSYPARGTDDLANFCRTCGFDVTPVWREFTWVKID